MDPRAASAAGESGLKEAEALFEDPNHPIRKTLNEAVERLQLQHKQQSISKLTNQGYMQNNAYTNEYQDQEELVYDIYIYRVCRTDE